MDASVFRTPDEQLRVACDRLAEPNALPADAPYRGPGSSEIVRCPTCGGFTTTRELGRCAAPIFADPLQEIEAGRLRAAVGSAG